ncbi:uncharacterized protein LOC132314340 [Cornus florida]|uniref:uncharacterized protein LOC132314340 n=1 Tax=Cornus florida TaxID=4283 RepID=UPI00289BF619|nr:uncharacterized protein LOC132314340 [Cornus florida]
MLAPLIHISQGHRTASTGIIPPSTTLGLTIGNVPNPTFGMLIGNPPILSDLPAVTAVLVYQPPVNNQHNQNMQRPYVQPILLVRDQQEVLGNQNPGRNARINRAQMLALIQAELAQGRRRARPVYRKPYPDYVDAHELPRNYRYLDFSMYYSEENFFMVQHIARFTAQCLETGPNPWLRMRLFSSSLARAVFEWYSNLLANSIQTRDEMEEAFHTQFYRTEIEATLADISRLSQLPSKSIETFVARFRKAKLKCRVSLPEPEYIKLALNGLDIEHRKRFDGVEFQDLFDLVDRASQFEEILKEEKERKNSSKGTYYKDPNYEVFSAEVGDELEVNVAEVNIKKPYICEALVKSKSIMGGNATSISAARKGPADIGKNYSFDLSKTDQIFDHLMADKMISLPKGHKIPSASDLKGKEYCKYHNSWNHATNDCIVLQGILQKSIDEGTLKFPEKTSDTMKVDINPFPTIKSTNVISLAK